MVEDVGRLEVPVDNLLAHENFEACRELSEDLNSLSLFNATVTHEALKVPVCTEFCDYVDRAVSA